MKCCDRCGSKIQELIGMAAMQPDDPVLLDVIFCGVESGKGYGLQETHHIHSGHGKRSFTPRKWLEVRRKSRWRTMDRKTQANRRSLPGSNETTIRKGGRHMTLWDMLDKTLYWQKVWIFETNAYDQNMPLFKGTVQDARQDADRVWDYLMCEVETYALAGGLLDIRVRDKYYNERLEGHYSISADRWGDAINTRPWRHSSEIDMEKAGIHNGN